MHYYGKLNSEWRDEEYLDCDIDPTFIYEVQHMYWEEYYVDD